MSARTLAFRICLLLAAGSSIGIACAAQSAEQDVDLLSLDLEQLLDVEVELASRAPQRAFDAATAIYVIDRSDIERSASRQLPDLLRQVPGLHVGRWDGNKWAVSSRNALGRFASTMLVMVDGRHVYTPLYGGVRWEQLNLPLDDVERIEVVRGPAGPLWGANAVDGVVNIVTRTGAATAGTLVAASAGSGSPNGELVLRRAVGAGDASYRVTAHYVALDEGVYLPTATSTHRGARIAGETANDAGTARRVDLRADWAAGERASATLVAGVFDADFDEERLTGGAVVPNAIAQRSAYAQLQWRRATDDGGEWRFGAAATRGVVEDDIADDRETLVDLDLQRAGAAGPLQLIWGLGFRHYRSTLRVPDLETCRACFGAHPERGGNDTASGFVHGRWQASPSLAVVAGVRLESSDYVDFEWQPTLRIVAGDRQRTLWAAATRALRTPTRLDRDLAFYRVPDAALPAFGCLEISGTTCRVGDRDSEPWEVVALEAGFRAQPSARFGYDLVAFEHDFRNTIQRGATVGRDRVQGVEAEARFAPAQRWQIGIGYANHRGRNLRASGAIETLPLLPRHSAMLRSSLALSPAWSFDVQASHISSLPRGAAPPLQAQARVDLRLAWRPRPGLSATLAVLDALDEVQAEYIEALKINSGAGRGVQFGFEWRFE